MRHGTPIENELGCKHASGAWLKNRRDMSSVEEIQRIFVEQKPENISWPEKPETMCWAEKILHHSALSLTSRDLFKVRHWVLSITGLLQCVATYIDCNPQSLYAILRSRSLFSRHSSSGQSQMPLPPRNLEDMKECTTVRSICARGKLRLWSGIQGRWAPRPWY